MTVKKSKIEAIYPLNTVQQGLLFHHLMEGEDQGLLTVQCILEGNVDVENLKKAWSLATERHEVMRTTVHWKNLEKPILVVRPEKEILWTILDWSNKSETEQEVSFEEYKKEVKNSGANLEKTPLSKISLIQKTATSYYILWQCHHLLLDGWSSTIILKDAFKFYDGLLSEEIPELQTVPSFKSYNNWLKNNFADEAAGFWSKTFNDFKAPILFQQKNVSRSTPNQNIKKYAFDVKTSEDLKNLAKKYRVTLNTLFQGIWSLALSKCFNKTDVTFGNTVSGRSVPFTNINLMAGMFTNVLPVRANLKATNNVKDALATIQSQQQEARNFEYCKIDEITSWAQLPEDKALFDSLFVFENFPWEDIASGNVKVKGFESGITTTYPVTAIFKIEEFISYELIVNRSIISEEMTDWFLNIVPNICTLLLQQDNVEVSSVLEKLPVFTGVFLEAKENLIKKEAEYIAPRNQIELSLVEIWEQLFGSNSISITDSFFDLGGKSLLSVKMFALIQEKLSVKLPPTTLLEFPTIKELSAIIASKGNKEIVSWKYLVPIKAKGKKVPLFCIHAGGGHVFFYKGLADAIDKERPVYALQPVGIFGDEDKHQSIQEMAKDYADEICAVQPKGILNIVVYCFSTAVGLEMVSYLKSIGRETHLIVADTIADHRLLLDKERLQIRVSAFLKRFFSNPFKALNEMIGFRIMFYLKPLKVKFFGNEAEKNTENMRLHLVRLFNAYQWNSKADNLSLVLTEKGDERYNKEIQRSWKPIVNGTIVIEVCKANHKTLFEQPDVLAAAKAIDKVIVEN